MEPELAGVGAAVLADGGGFEPDELGAAGGEALVAADGEFAGIAVELAIAAFHGMDGHGVAHGDGADLDFAAQEGLQLFFIRFEADELGALFSVLF